MFTIFRRPKPLFKKNQIVAVRREEGIFMKVQERHWVRQSGYAHWDWFYRGPIFQIEGKGLAIKAKDESHQEQELGGIGFF